jgi:hypothetical protein
MPRSLPQYDQDFSSEAAKAALLVGRLEQSLLAPHPEICARIKSVDVEFAYELAYLRTYLAWEVLLEQTLIRLICGYHKSSGPEPLKSGTNYFSRLSDAENAVLGGRRYKLWHDPAIVAQRASRWLDNSLYEQIILSSQAKLEHFAAVRHRIAHSQKDAQSNFDMTTMTLAGKRYPASRPGRFLRDRQSGSSPPRRWLSVITNELTSLATQLCN